MAKKANRDEICLSFFRLDEQIYGCGLTFLNLPVGLPSWIQAQAINSCGLWFHGANSKMVFVFLKETLFGEIIHGCF